MTDKQIIIDGVDVSECEFAVKPINDNRIKCHCAKGLLQIAKMQEQPESIKSGLCENNPNCYYKQLKRKEQKCEELKEKIKYMEEYIKTVENSRNEFDKESKINGKIEYDIKSDMIAQEEKKKIKRSECPYGGIDCAWCLEDCE